MSYARTQQEEARLAAEIQGLLRRSGAVDAEEDSRYGAECTGDELPAELAHRAGRLAKIRHSEWRCGAAAETEPLPGGATAKQRMQHRLRTPGGRAEYDKR